MMRRLMAVIGSLIAGGLLAIFGSGASAQTGYPRLRQLAVPLTPQRQFAAVGHYPLNGALLL